MVYLLDTDISSYVIKQRSPSVLAKFESVHADNLSVSIITVAELRYGVERSSSARINISHVEAYCAKLLIWPWDFDAAVHYARIRFQLEKQGTPLAHMDLMIAAHALALNAVLVTNNIKHFDRVPGLKVETWV